MTPPQRALEYLKALGRAWILGKAEPEGGTAAPNAREGLASSRLEAVEHPPAWPEDAAVAEAVETLARTHGLLPWLHSMGERYPVTRPPLAETWEGWERERFESFAFQSALYDLLAEVVQGCEAGGCPVVILKGPAAAARVWRDVGLRPTGDLDLYCRRSDLPAVARVVRAAGLSPEAHTATYHLTFRGPQPRFVVELHFGLYDFLRGTELESGLWDQIEAVDLDGRRVPALSPEAALVFDVAHWIHHDGRVRLPQLFDLAATVWRPVADPVAGAELFRAAGLADEAGVAIRGLGRFLALPPGPEPLVEPRGLESLDRAWESSVEQGVLERHPGEKGGPLAETLARSGWERLGHALRLIAPAQAELQALYGCSWLGALARRPLHLARASGRALGKLRAARRRGGLPGGRPAVSGEPATSLKRAVYRSRSRALGRSRGRL